VKNGARGVRWLLLAVPFVGVGVGVRYLIPEIGDEMARKIASVAPKPPPVATGASAGDDSIDSPSASSRRGARTGDPDDASLQPASPSASSRQGPSVADGGALDGAASDGVAEGAIFIPADRLTRLTVKALRRVHVTNATDADGRLIGARLSGVGALGLGLAEGDVITSIAGRPTPTADEATAAATSAYASGARRVSATVRRGDQTLVVTAEIPLIDAG
jgi:hypothetical protein